MAGRASREHAPAQRAFAPGRQRFDTEDRSEGSIPWLHRAITGALRSLPRPRSLHRAMCSHSLAKGHDAPTCVLIGIGPIAASQWFACWTDPWGLRRRASVRAGGTVYRAEHVLVCSR